MPGAQSFWAPPAPPAAPAVSMLNTPLSLLCLVRRRGHRLHVECQRVCGRVGPSRHRSRHNHHPRRHLGWVLRDRQCRTRVPCGLSETCHQLASSDSPRGRLEVPVASPVPPPLCTHTHWLRASTAELTGTSLSTFHLAFPFSPTSCRPAAFTPSSFNFVGPSPGGPGTGTQQQAGSVSPGGTQAASNVAGTGEPAR